MLAVGADGAESADLERIASEPYSHHVHKIPDYEGLSDIVDQLVETICRAARGFYSQRSKFLS